MKRIGALVCSLTVAPLLLSVAACSGAADDATQSTTESGHVVAPTRFPEGESLQVIDIDGVQRRFFVHVPAGVGQPRAAVFVLHGGGGEGVGVAEVGEHPLSVFRTVADRERLVVVYPEGLPANDRQGAAGWVDCRSDNRVSSGADDIDFLAALVESVGAAYGLPPSSMFMAGGSNGAQMTHAFAFAHPELLGAVATGSGSLPVEPLPGPCTNGPAQSIPILLVHGTADTQMPYAGGCVANIGGSCNRGKVVSAVATRDRWLAINGLIGVAPVETTIELAAADGGAAHRFVYAGPSPVEWWRLDGAGHTVASRTVLVEANGVTGVQNRDIEFAEVAWAFFEQLLP